MMGVIFDEKEFNFEGTSLEISINNDNGEAALVKTGKANEERSRKWIKK